MKLHPLVLILFLILFFEFPRDATPREGQIDKGKPIDLSLIELKRSIERLVTQHQGRVAVAIEFLDSGKAILIDENRVMPTASLIKIAVMHEAYAQAQAGRLDLKQQIVLKAEDKVPGSGVLTSHFQDGLTLTLADAIQLMIAYSDNTATNLVLDKVGLQNVCDGMKKIGFPETRINSKVYRGSTTSLSKERSATYGLGSTTAQETLDLLKQIYKKQAVSESASEAMLRHLYACEDDTKLAVGFPAGTRFAHKTGAISHARCDAGILETSRGPVAIVVLTSQNKDKSWTPNNQALLLCRRIGSLVYTLVTQESVNQESESIPTRLASGSFGRLVEDLQRTLNAKLKPSPGLSVDGDFGPATKAAVMQFQKSRGLSVDGIFDQNDWAALGTLVTQDKPVPSPENVNSEKLKKNPADALAGVPFVTAKAWAIANLADGKILFHSQKDQQLDIASTTKIMTAYLVLELAATDPSILEEKITFSQRADRTRGSTSGIRAGEIVTVKELLFGLLLPSGNDASVAFAEHFGSRLAKSTEKKSSYELFIQAMNDKAKSLAMNDSQFRNPHGLTASGHQSTAADLVKLATAAMRLKSFRDYVSTRQHGTTLESQTGYRRNVVWKNTNQLLGIEGYIGLKTGTTTAAGACLVSACRRDGKAIVLVVLGSGSSRGRYVDSRNLYRWAWNKLLTK